MRGHGGSSVAVAFSPRGSGQQFFDPDPEEDKTAPDGVWKPEGPFDLRLYNFGRFPDTSVWQPGDLLLFSKVHPSWGSRRIIHCQCRGGYAHVYDACWHHAAVYLGDESLCEATPIWVRHGRIDPYIGEYFVRIRRDYSLTPNQGWRIAINALTRVGTPYSLPGIARLGFQSMRGYWKPWPGTSRLGARSVVCSKLYAEAYTAVTGRTLENSVGNETTPAFLSRTSQLKDVPTTWLRIA